MSIASRIEAIEGHIGDIYDTLELGGSDLTNTDKNIVNINSQLIDRYKDYLANGIDELWNNWDKATETGVNEATINNTIKAKMDIDFKGDTKQNTTTGKNLLPSDLTTLTTRNTGGTWNNGVYTRNDVTFTPVYTNGMLEYVIVNGQASDNISFQFGTITPISSSTSYTVSGCPSGGSSTTYRIWLDYIGGDDGSGKSGAPGVTSALNCFINIKLGASISNLKFYPMVRLTSITDSTYEPYTAGASPNPSYPQEIKNAKGKNLFDGEIETGYININNGQNTGSINVRTANYIPILSNTQYTISSDTSKDTWACFYDINKTFLSNLQIKDYRYSSGTFTTPNNAKYIRWYDAVSTGDNPKWQLEEGSVATPYLPYNTVQIKVQNKNLFDEEFRQGTEQYTTGNAYVFSENNLNLGANTYTFSNTLPNTFQYAIFGCAEQFPTSSSKIYNSGWKTGGASLTFTFSQSLYLGILIKKSDSSNISPSDINTYNFMLEQGSTASTYVAHQEQVVNFPLSEGQVLHEGDYLADDGVHSGWGQVILNGTENWSFENISSSPVDRTVIRRSHQLNYKARNTYVCNYFIANDIASGNYFTLGASMYLSLADSITGITSEDDNSTKINKMKAWLTTHNLIIQYELATPTTTPYTSEQQEAWEQIKALMSYNEQTNISQEGDLPFKLDVTALVELS